MNIFATSPSPDTSALWLDDVRKNKMILETAQLLSASVRINSMSKAWGDKVYKLTHTGHPCCVWTCHSKGNFRWLLDHMIALAAQWGRHKSADLIPVFEDYYHHGYFLSDEQTKHPNCAANADQGLSFKHISNVHEAYQLYLNERWKRDTIHLSWVHGEKPEWHYDKKRIIIIA